MTDPAIKACPTPIAHRRLEEAHQFWHACLDNYENPALFRANLNAAIQALRNTTFGLQKRKAMIEGFDAWYKPHQDAMKRDDLMGWVVKSRNRIVKEDDLETFSSAHAWIVSDYISAASAMGSGLPRDEATTQSQPPPKIPGDVDGEVRRDKTVPPRYGLQQIIDMFARSVPAFILKDSYLTLERRWVDRALPDWELLDAMAHVYGALRDVIRDAHRHVGGDANCDPELTCPEYETGETNSDARSRLPCMVTSRTERTFSMRLSDHELEGGGLVVPVEPSDELSDATLARYGLVESDRNAGPPPESPLDLVPLWVKMGRQILMTDPDHGWFFYPFRGPTMYQPMVVAVRDKIDKYDVAQRLGEYVAVGNFDGFIMVSEVWMAPPTFNAEGGLVNATDNPERTEGLQIHAEVRDGRALNVIIPFVRDGSGKVTIGEEFENEVEPGAYNFIRPIRRAWGQTAPAEPDL